MRNIFEGAFTEEGTGSGKDIFEGVFNFSASEARKKSHSIDSEVHREEYRSTSPSTQEYQKLEGKLKHDLAGERLGSDQGAIGE